MNDTAHDLKRLFEHAAWANERVVEALGRSADPRALELFAHLLGSEVVWYARIETGQSAHLQIWPSMSLDDCAALARESARGYRRLVAGLAPDDLHRSVTYRSSKGTEFHTPLADVLFHVAMHGSYHRGQIALRLRESGGDPVNTDYITWQREVGADPSE